MTEIDKPMKNKLNLKYFTVFKLGLKLFLSQFCEKFYAIFFILQK